MQLAKTALERRDLRSSVNRPRTSTPQPGPSNDNGIHSWMPIDQRPEMFLDDPTQMQTRLSLTKCAGKRPRVDDVTEGGEADEDDSHSTRPFDFGFRISDFGFAITRPRNFGFRISDFGFRICHRMPTEALMYRPTSLWSRRVGGGKLKTQPSKLKPRVMAGALTGLCRSGLG